MFAITLVVLTNVVLFTVMPVQLNETAAPLANLVPVMVTLLLSAPAPNEFGLAEVTVGVLPATVKQPVHDPMPPSPFVTTTSHAPGDAPVRLKVEVMIAGEFTVFDEATMADCPVLVSLAVAPTTNPEPWIWIDADPLFAAVFGDVLVTIGAALTVKHAAHAPTTPSVFVTLAARVPVAASDATVMFAVTEVVLVNVVEFTVMPVSAPPPVNDTTAPRAKFVPVTTML